MILSYKKVFSIPFLIFFLLIIPFTSILKADNSIVEGAKTFALEKANLILQKARTLNNEEDFIKFLNSEVDNIVLIDYMALWVLGANRTSFSSDQLSSFIYLFRTRLIKFYGSIIYQSRDKGFILKGATTSVNNRVTVDFYIPLENQNLTLEWQIRKANNSNKYLVTDFIVNGVSFLQSKRAEYNALFQKCGKDPKKFLEEFDKVNHINPLNYSNKAK